MVLLSLADHRMSDTECETRPVGRPRSDQARQAILTSALELIETQQPNEITIKSIAEAARVGRQTVYRWWNNRGEIVLEALLEISNKRLGPYLQSSAQERVKQFVRDTVQQAGIARQALAVVMIDAQADARFLEHFKVNFIELRRAAFFAVLEADDAYPSLRPTDKQLAADLIYGPLWYRLLVDHAPLNRRFADELALCVDDWLKTRSLKREQ